MTPSLCDSLHPFLLGELSAADADAFRDHLASCDACSQALHAQMMMEAVEQTHAPSFRGSRGAGAGGGEPRPVLSRRRWRAATAAVLLPTVAAAAGWLLVVRGHEESKRTVAQLTLEVAPHRSIELRVAYGAADAYRPYDVARAAGDKPHEDVPLAALATLESKGDWHGVAAGLLLAGDHARAASALGKAPASPAVDADRAALLLQEGKTEEALTVLDAVLAKEPNRPQALWNRALALRNLELPLSAAEAFDRVAALGEHGWAEEAKQRATALRTEEEQRQADAKAAAVAARSMVAGAAPVGDEVLGKFPGIARRYLYHAVRAATSSARVLEFLPLAKRLDDKAGGHVLEAFVAKSAAANFAKRAAFGETYARLVLTKGALDAKGAEAYLNALRAAGESDVLFGALLLTGQAPKHVEELEKIAKGGGDPWLRAIAAEVRADVLLRRDDFARAEQTLRAAIAEYSHAHVDEPVVRLERSLGVVLSYEMRTPDARATGRSGLARSRASAPEYMPDFLLRLEDVARLLGNVPGVVAYEREAVLLHVNTCASTRAIHLNAAEAYLDAFDVVSADRELREAPRCDDPVPYEMVDLSVDSLRMGGTPASADAFTSDLEAARALRSQAGKAWSDVILARFRYLTDPAAGDALARRALDEARATGGGDELAEKAETFARRTLAVAAATGGRGEAALAELMAGAGAKAGEADGCAFGVAVDNDRLVTATRDPSGVFVAELSKLETPAVTPETVTTKAALQRLARCPSVRVYALPPVHGLARLFPPNVAWGYGGGASAAAGPAARRVVVSDTMPPSDLELPRLGSWGPPEAGATWIHGMDATPKAVLAELATATEVEIHAHGVVDATATAASLIALSPDADGKYALSVADLQPGALHGHPIVVLGACHAAKAAPYLHEAWSLPTAFVRAGARAVFGSPSAISDAEARPFFDAVLTRIRGGAVPAVALRDERVAWLSRSPTSWVADVIEFE